MNLEGCVYKFKHICTCNNIREKETINLRESWGRYGRSLMDNMGMMQLYFYFENCENII